MILTLAVVLGFAASLVRHQGRTFSQIASIPLRSAWLALLALALQWPLLRAPAGPTQSFSVQRALFVLSHLLLLAFIWRNRRLVGVLVIGLGVMCNLVVIVINGGLMPITPETLVEINNGSTAEQWPVGDHYGYSKDIILIRQETKLWALSDIFALPPPFPKPVAFSLGDLLIALGVVVLLQGSSTLLEPATAPP
jgi:hypothetical protein